MSEDLTDEFPILCETCLGPNPYVRMTQEAHAKACKVCDRPMTVFRWKPGAAFRYKKTEVCKTCARLKNVCQTCILDLQYGLPVQVRDAALEEQGRLEMPTSTTMRDFMYEQLEKKMAQEGSGTAYGRVKRPNAMLHRLQRSGPYYERNKPHICSFFVKGTCNRGAECPYRHEKPPENGPLADQNIKDRFYGNNDPVALKLMGRYDKMKESENKLSRQGPPVKPQDPTVRTLYVGGIDATYTEDQIREHFEPFGAIHQIHLIGDRGCCFVTFVNRNDAETAVNSLYDCLFIRGRRMKVVWGKGREVKKGGARRSRPAPPGMKKKVPQQQSAVPAPGMRMPMPIRAQVPRNQSLGGAAYPSMQGGFGTSNFNSRT